MTFIGLLQPYLFELFVPRDSADDLEPSMRTIGIGSYILYTLVIVLVYNLVFFTLETFNFFNWMEWLLRIGGSTAITMLLIMALELPQDIEPCSKTENSKRSNKIFSYIYNMVDYNLDKRKYVIGGVAIAIVVIYTIRLFTLQIMSEDYKKNADSNAFLKQIEFP